MSGSPVFRSTSARLPGAPHAPSRNTSATFASVKRTTAARHACDPRLQRAGSTWDARRLHSGLFAERFALGYRLLWQRIADHAFQFPWNLFYVPPGECPFPGVLSRGFAESTQVAVKATGLTAQPGRKVWLGTISLAPLDAVSILTLHALLPALLMLDGWQRWRGLMTFLPRGTLILLTAVIYGLVLFSVAEGGENMRFLVATEPEVLALVACTFAGLWQACRRKVDLHTGQTPHRSNLDHLHHLEIAGPPSRTTAPTDGTFDVKYDRRPTTQLRDLDLSVPLLPAPPTGTPQAVSSRHAVGFSALARKLGHDAGNAFQ